jgi:DNA primase
MDVIALHQAGFENAVACLGTALTDEQARLVASYADEVITCYDSDDAGQKATNRAFSIFDKLGIKVTVLSIPDAKDPDEFIKKFGAGRFKLLIDGAKSVTDFLIANIAQKYNLTLAADKVSYLKEVSSVLAGLPSPVERDVYIRKTASELDLSPDAIKVQVDSLIASRKKRENKRQERDLTIAVNRGLEKVDPERAKHLREAKCEDEILGCLFKNPDKLEWVLEKIKPENFVTSFNKRIFTALTEKIKQFGHIDISDFSGDFSPEDMGRISRILQGASLNFDEKVMTDYIKALLDCAEKPDTVKIKQMSDEELQNYINAVKDKKNRS